jgi:hypothetical protein
MTGAEQQRIASESRDAALVLIRTGGKREGRLCCLARPTRPHVSLPFGGEPFPPLEPDISRVEHDRMKLLVVTQPDPDKSNLPWGINIWTANGKVLNVEWSERPERFRVITFNRGAWEAELQALAE